MNDQVTGIVTAPQTDMENRSWRGAAALVLLTLAAYANSLWNGFVWDDEVLVRENPHIRNLTYLPTLFTSDLVHNSHGGPAYYRPLQAITYLLDYQLWGTHPTGYHLTNILLHALCVVLVWMTLRRLVSDPLIPLLVAAVFAVHPLNTSAVTYIAGRADSLALAGMLGAFLFHHHYRQQQTPRVLFFVAALLCYVAALFSRENALLFPVLLVVLSGPPWRRAFQQAIPFALLAVAFLIWRAAVIEHVEKPVLGAWPIPWDLRLQLILRSLATYFGLLFWPVHLQMDRSVAFAPWQLAIAGLLVASVLITALWWTAHREPVAFRGLLWFVVTLLPLTGALNLVATVAEHWLYVPMIGFYLALAIVVVRHTRWLLPATGVVLCALMLRTVVRNRDWTDGTVFFTRQAHAAAHSERTFTNLGHTLVVTGQTDAGLAALERAEQLNPRCPTAKYNLAVVLALRGDTDRAQEKLTACLALAPDDPTGWELAAQLAEARGDVRQALHDYRRAISCTREVGLRLRFVRFLVRHGRTREALATLEECQYLEPGHAGTYRLLADLFTAIGQTARAAEARQLAASLDPHS